MQRAFILHLNKDKRGLLAQMMEAIWTREKEKQATTMPLRCHLFKLLTQTLYDRFLQVIQGQDRQSLQAQLKASQLLLEDGSWPILQWDPQESKLKIGKKPPITPKKDPDAAMDNFWQRRYI